MKYLVTGGTGFIGAKLVDRLLEDGHEVIVLTRTKRDSHIPKLQYLKIDISDSLAPFFELNTVMKSIDSVIHAAALYDLKSNYVESYLINILGTSNILELIKKFPNIKEFHYVSTIAVNPLSATSIIGEDELDLNSPEQDAYAKSKNQAEAIVRQAKLPNNVKIRIYRPGIVIADSSQNFEVQKADGPYLLINAMIKHQKKLFLLNFCPFLFLPFHPQAAVHFIPVNTLTNWLFTMITNVRGDQDMLGFHLFGEKAYSTEKFLANVLKYFGVKSKLAPLPNIVTPFRKKIKLDSISKYLPLPLEVLDYMFNTSVYSFKNRKKFYPELEDFNFSEHLQDFLDGAKKSLGRDQ